MMDTIVSFVGGVSGASVMGSSHVSNGKPNQDAVAWKQVCLWTFLAVADGHGGAPHYRSDRGSRFAVETLLTLFETITRGGMLREPDALAASVQGLAERLVTLWRGRVEDDIARDPVPEPSGFRSHSVYGTTCLGAAVGPGVSLMLQIGDGGLYVGTASDDVGLLFPSDDLEGEQTYSLCLPDAAENVKIALYTAPNRFCAPDFILASTDGLIKSFASEAAVLDIVRHYRDAIRRNGLRDVVAELDAWLSKTSELGSGDDMSVAIFTTAVEQAGLDYPGLKPVALGPTDMPPKSARPNTGRSVSSERTEAGEAKFGRNAIIAAAAAGALVALPIGIVGALRFTPSDKPATPPIALPAVPPTPVDPVPDRGRPTGPAPANPAPEKSPPDSPNQIKP